MALIIEGDDLSREIVTSYLEKKSSGILNLSASTTIYFQNTNQKEIENIIKTKSNIEKFEWKKVYKEDWTANWKPFFKKKNINNEVEIIPSWENSDSNSDMIVIKIDPGMAFGTGHHETTEMMIEAMLEFYKNSMSVLDLGTGSGILSILAYKLKSKKIIAIDNDSEIKNNFKENMKLNNAKVELKIKSCLNMKDFNFDLVLANINKNVLIKFLSKLKRRNNIIILSGFLKSDYKDIFNIISQIGYEVVKKYNKKEWLCLVIK